MVHTKKQMTRLIPAAIIAATTVGATEGTSLLIENHSLGLPTMIGIASVIGGSAWWLASKFQCIDDKFSLLNVRLDGLWCVRSNEDGCKRQRRNNRKRKR
jgi:hypothetical protein